MRPTESGAFLMHLDIFLILIKILSPWMNLDSKLLDSKDFCKEEILKKI
jgi:hypothetical protein